MRDESEELAASLQVCARSLLASAHACLATSFDFGSRAGAVWAYQRICNAVAGECLALHRLLVDPPDGPSDVVAALARCANDCRRAEALVQTLAEAGLASPAAAAACGRCATACLDLADRLRSTSEQDVLGVA